MDFISEDLVARAGRGRLQSSRAKLKFIMRASFFYAVLIISSSQLLWAYPSFGQPEDRVTNIEMKGESIEILFKKLKAQANLSFVLSGDVEKYDNISLPMAERTVKEVLDEVLGERGLAYNFKGNIVLIYKKGKNEKKVATSEPSEVPDVMFLVSGEVIDAESQQPLPGVNVFVKSTNRGTSTDVNGRFSINAEENEILVFSFIGFITQEIKVTSQTALHIAMASDMNELKAVTINAGYYKTTDKTKTGSIVKITAKEIENQPVTSPLLALQGRVPGLEITPANGIPGVAPKIRIRGENSLRKTGGFPLYVIDGIVIDSQPLKSGSTTLLIEGMDPLSNLNPNDIESIEVLKDADATSIYGSRGANGVILITTKKGKEGRGTKMDVNVYRGIGKIASKIDMLNTETYLDMRREALRNDGKMPSVVSEYDVNGVWDTTRYTDWQKVLLGGSAQIADVQLGFSGGNEFTSFRLGGDFHKETLVLPGDFGYRRAVGNFSLDHHSADKKFNIALSLNYGRNKNNLYNGSGIASAALDLPPNAPPLYQKDGNLNWELVPSGGSFVNTWNNPLAVLLNTHDVESGTLLANGIFSYEILPKLSLRTSIGYTEVNGNENFKSPILANSPVIIPSGITGTSSFGDNQRRSWIAEPQVNYGVKINKHKIDVVTGASFQESTSRWKSIEGQGYTSDVLLNSIQGASSVIIRADEFSQYRYMAFFLRAGYDFDGKYLLNLTGRRDGSSRFGPGNRYGNFGAIGAAWVFSSERFIADNVPFLSFGKLRASYGSTGNDQIGDYQFYSLYKINSSRYQNNVTLSPDALFNENFQWEVTKKLEATLELGLANERITFETSWYRNRSSNQLVNYPIPAVTGFPNILRNFNATIENSGWEFLLHSQNINGTTFRWRTSINLTLPRNELVDFPGIEQSPYATLYKVGEPLAIRRLYTWGGVDPLTGDHLIVDKDDNGAINDGDRSFMEPAIRKYYGGVENTISFKSFEFTFLFQFSKQRGTRFSSILPGRVGNQAAREVENPWRNEGDVTEVAKLTTNTLKYRDYILYVLQSNYNIVDASFVKLKTVTLAYSIPPWMLEKTKLKNSRIYVQGQNLYTFSNFLGFDPETGARTLPPLRMVTCGVQLTF